MSQLTPRPLALCHFTTVEVEPPAFVDVAARAGHAARAMDSLVRLLD